MPGLTETYAPRATTNPFPAPRRLREVGRAGHLRSHPATTTSTAQSKLGGILRPPTRSSGLSDTPLQVSARNQHRKRAFRLPLVKLIARSP
jgi:hypothetical protein